jgi:glycosyltransferase involved in cell wall biosynthesis
LVPQIEKPSVEVIIFTYNHEAFIEEALLSVASQDYSGKIKVRILDDSSSDSTFGKAKMFMERHGIDYEIESSSVNKYATGRYFRWEFIQRAKSDYIAFLDGDDFWVDSEKLSIQIAGLEKNRNLVLSHHLFSSVSGDGQVVPQYPPVEFWREEIPGRELADHNFIGTSTVVLRVKDLPESLDSNYDSCRIDDYPLWAVFSSGRSIGFVARDMARYRRHPEQSFAGLDPRVQRTLLIDTIFFIQSQVNREEQKVWRDRLFWLMVSDAFDNCGSTAGLFRKLWRLWRDKIR